MTVRILVVDDDRSTLQLLEYVLKRAGYEVFCATDGADGLVKVEDVLPHLIICDVLMPEVDGLEMCRRVRQQPGFELIPFIFLSARSQIEERVEGLEIGADDYIAKPFDRGDLLARIDVVLRRADAFQRTSRTDTLTQLGNREQFEERLQEELYRAQRYGVSSTLALVAIDVDDLEALEQGRGSQAGDALLRHVGRFLRDNVRALDVPARYSQSGFIVLMPHTSRDRAKIAIDRLSARLDQSRLHLGNEDLPVSCSFGVAIVDRGPADMTEMINRAHESMMMARRTAGVRVHVWQEDPALVIEEGDGKSTGS